MLLLSLKKPPRLFRRIIIFMYLVELVSRQIRLYLWLLKIQRGNISRLCVNGCCWVWRTIQACYWRRCLLFGWRISIYSSLFKQHVYGYQNIGNATFSHHVFTYLLGPSREESFNFWFCWSENTTVWTFIISCTHFRWPFHSHWIPIKRVLLCGMSESGLSAKNDQSSK